MSGHLNLKARILSSARNADALAKKTGLKHILHGCRRLFKRIARIYEVSCWLDMSARRQDWRDQAEGWIPPMDKDF